jgi:methylated-DNA-protein-cysteine methyltransferase-like protein
VTKGREKYFDDIYSVVKLIPAGKVMSYGQIGAIAGTTARIAGSAMAHVDDNSVPWHRVVGADGCLRVGRRSPELMAVQRMLLEQEGVNFTTGGCVHMLHHAFPM